jgi:hypothetical protein
MQVSPQRRRCQRLPQHLHPREITMNQQSHKQIEKDKLFTKSLTN